MPTAAHTPCASTRLLTTLGVIAVVSGYVGSVIGPSLVAGHSTLLIAVDSRTRHLILAVAVGISPWLYATVATTRLLIADPVFFILGRRHGDDLPAILERRLPMIATSLPAATAIMRRFGQAAVFVAPNATISALAGMTRMPARRFAITNVAGTATRLTVVWWLANRFESTTLTVASWTSSNRALIAAAAAFVVVAQLARSYGRRGSTPTATNHRADETPDTPVDSYML